MSYDIVGDIHGEAEKLEALLVQLGYVAKGRGYKAPTDRQLVFVGDLIDRGAGQLRVLEIVRAMMDSGDALSVMGNHEFNAIAYAVENPETPGERFRPNRGNSEKCRKNQEQHSEFLAQIGEGSQRYGDLIDWFRELPPFLDLGGIRVAHACWDDNAASTLSSAGWIPGKPLSDELLAAVYAKDDLGNETPLMAARKRMTCGLEIKLRDGQYILDKAGHKHNELRIADWRHWARSIADVALVPKGQEDALNGIEWPEELQLNRIEGAPVFIGHHWFSGMPVLESEKLACLDWSVAKGGPLVAYRWDGESELREDKLVWFGAIGG